MEIVLNSKEVYSILFFMHSIAVHSALSYADEQSSPIPIYHF